MMNILITESQLEMLSNHEQLALQESSIELDEQNSSPIMGLKDLVEMICRQGYEEQIILEMIIKKYKEKGDDGVMDMFKQMTGVSIVPICRGKYIFNYK